MTRPDDLEPTGRLDTPSCPECQQGKHDNCDTTSWNVVTDEPQPCPCWESGHAYY